MIAGSWVGKRVLDRLSVSLFVTLIDGVLVISGLLLIATG